MNIYKTAQAAAYLNEVIPESLDYWHHYLLNNRKTNRNPPYRLPCEKLSCNIVYRENELIEFVKWEKYRRKGSIGLSKYTHLHKVSYDLHESKRYLGSEFIAFLSIDNVSRANNSIIKLILHNPTSVHRMTLDEAEALQRQLKSIINEIKST